MEHAHRPLPRTEAAVLSVLVEAGGRVVGRETIIRRAGLAGLDPRRCESAIANLRRMLGAGSILNVRRRGWMVTTGTAAAPSHAPAAAPEPLR